MKPRRAVRRRTKRSVNRGGGKTFFVVSLLILIFAAAYYFIGDYIFPGEYVEPAAGEIIVSFLDVGQGDSILIRTVDHAVLIDGGEHRARNVVLDYLRNAGITRLDYVIATHPHSDHIGGLVTVLGRVDVGRVVMPDIMHNTVTFESFLEAIENNNIPVKFPVAGDRVQVGLIDLTVISPTADFSGSLNDASIVLRLNHGRTSFLFTGDAESAAELNMVNSGMVISSDVLNVGHHGSRTSTTQVFLDAVDPAVAVISLAANNRYGHPHREVMERLQYRGIQILRTDESGTIRMITNGERIYLY